MKGTADMGDRRIIVEITRKCNSRCIQCSYWKKNNSEEISVEKYTDLMEWSSRLGVKELQLTGGEPLLHSKIQDIINITNNYGIKTKICSNGLLLGAISKSQLKSIDEFVISLDAVDASTYREVRGIDAFDIVISNIKQLKNKEPKVKVAVSYLIQKKNYLSAIEFMDFARMIGADRINYLFPNRFGDFNKEKDIDVYYSELFLNDNDNNIWKDKLFYEFKEKCKENKDLIVVGENTINTYQYYFDISRKVRNNICQFPFSAIYIDVFGKLRICPFLDYQITECASFTDFFSKVREEYIKNINEYKRTCCNCLEVPID